jgi:hypothetical protein
MNFASDLVYAYDRDLSDASSDSDSEDDFVVALDEDRKMVEEDGLEGQAVLNADDELITEVR